MAFQDVAHRLVTDRIVQVGQGSDDPVVAPGAILPRHAHDQRLQRRVDRGAPWGLALLRAIKFLRHKFAVPAENRVGFDDVGDFLQYLLAQLMTDFRQSVALTITELHTPLDLVAEYPVLCRQILVAQQQCLIDSPRDVCQQCLPIHTPFTLRLSLSHLALSRRDRVGNMQVEASVMAGL